MYLHVMCVPWWCKQYGGRLAFDLLWFHRHCAIIRSITKIEKIFEKLVANINGQTAKIPGLW